MGWMARAAMAGTSAIAVASAWFVGPASAQTNPTIIPVGPGPSSIALDPSSGDVYVANENGHSISVVDETGAGYGHRGRHHHTP